MDRLIEIFSMQRSLMHHFMEIERRNGLLITDQVPVNITSFAGQARLRDFAWRVVEEYIEARDELQRAGHSDAFAEEMIDTLHFLVELAILSGVEATSYTDLIHDPRLPDRLDHLVQCQSFDSLRILEDRFLSLLGQAMHGLKNRPWKQAHRDTDVARYQATIRAALATFLALCAGHGLSASKIFGEYERKHAINHERIKGGH